MLSMTSWLYRTVKYIHGGGSNAVSAVDAREVEKVKLNVASQKVVKFKNQVYEPLVCFAIEVH
jgi:hypothetical protein